MSLWIIISLVAHDGPVPEIPASDWPMVSSTLRTWSVEQGIFPKSERWFVSQGEWEFDLRMARTRYRILCDSPAIGWCHAFAASAEDIDAIIARNQVYLRWLWDMQCVNSDRADAYEQERLRIMEATEALFPLSVALDTDFSIIDRRDALRRYRDAVGPENFYRGYFPMSYEGLQ